MLNVKKNERELRGEREKKKAETRERGNKTAGCVVVSLRKTVG